MRAGRSSRGRGAAPAALGLLTGLLLLLLAGCGNEDRSRERGDDTPAHGEAPESAESAAGALPPLQDQAGRTVRLERPPRRIVSLVPAATEILLELGVGDRLAGRTDFDDDPRVAELPSVGGGIDPSIERLVGLEADLVIRFEGQQDRATPPALDRAGIPHLAVRPDRIADVLEMVSLLGRATGRAPEAARLAGRIEDDLDAVRTRVAGAPRPSVAFLLGGDPPWVVAEGTFLHELLEIAGGGNALAGAGTLYAPVSVEEIVEREVDLVLTVDGARVPPSLSDLTLRRVPDDVQSPGIHLARSARRISEALHPELWR